MEERQDNTKNIKILRQRIKEEKVKELLTSAKQAQTRVSSILDRRRETVPLQL